MNQTVKRVILSGLFLALLAAGFIGLYKIFSWKDTTGDYFSCLEELKSVPANTVDVVAVGPSKAYGSFNPAILWENEGISSFTLSISGMAQTSAYYHLRELLKTQSPKVVLIEASLILTEDYLDKGNLYRNTIVMNPSFENFRLISDTKGVENKWDFYLRFPIVHGRYKEIQAEDFGLLSSMDKNCLGYYNGFLVEPQKEEDSFFAIESRQELPEETVMWLENILSLSKEYGFEPIFYMAPQIILPPNQARFNEAKDYLESKSVEVLDLNRINDEIGIDYSSDFSDGNHINTYGAIKVSNWLSDYLAENYDLADHRGDSKYERFDKCAIYYNEFLFDEELFNTEDTLEVVERASVNSNVLLINATLDGVSVSRGGDILFESSDGEKEYKLKLNEKENLYIKSINADGRNDSVICIGTDWYRQYGDTDALTFVYDLVTERVVVVCRD